MDLCLVHNGSLSNHNRLRTRLERNGIEIRTGKRLGSGRWLLDVADAAGGYLASGTPSGARRSGRFLYFCPLARSMASQSCATPIACKPAVLAETDEVRGRWPASSRRYPSLPGIDDAEVWEPKPARGVHLGRSRLMGSEVFDLATGELRQLNQRLHDLTEETAKTPWRILHPRGAHAVAAGVAAPRGNRYRRPRWLLLRWHESACPHHRPRNGRGRGGREHDVGAGESEGPRQPVRWGLPATAACWSLKATRRAGVGFR